MHIDIQDLPLLVVRSFKDDVTSTADSFKSWDTCMAKTACKVVAIVGIVLACLVVLWLILTVLQCCCMGKSCLEALCCCCCRPTNTKYVQQQPQQSAYDNPNMYGRQPAPMYQTQQPPRAYFTNTQGYEPVQNGPYQHDAKTAYDDENPFNQNHSYRGY